MINLFGSWAQGIVISVIIATIIEIILPNGSCKKYVRSIIGIYILFVIISPITKNVIEKINVDEVIEEYKTELEDSEKKFESKLENNSNRTIKDLYIANLEKDLKANLEEKGYRVDSSVIEIEEESYNIIKVKLYISNYNKKENDNQITVNKIEIGTKKEENYKLNEEQKKEVKAYVSQNYGVSEDKIEIT